MTKTTREMWLRVLLLAVAALAAVGAMELATQFASPGLLSPRAGRVVLARSSSRATASPTASRVRATMNNSSPRAKAKSAAAHSSANISFASRLSASRATAAAERPVSSLAASPNPRASLAEAAAQSSANNVPASQAATAAQRANRKHPGPTALPIVMKPMPGAENPSANYGNAGPVTMPPPLPPPQLTESDLEAFFDGLVPLQIERNNIAGAVVAVVKDGKVIFAKGYGYSDLKDRKPVSPETTLFRVGSISKLFTWTAVMQLEQAGKINLDQNVNKYLDFTVPDTFGKPVTMRDLMTHTPGFEEAIQDLIVNDDKHIPTLHDYLETHMPREIFTPGTTGAYSNYGATLAGYIVQRVSGEPFDDYIQKHIFEPLGMKYASFRQPLPKDLQPFMSQGFELASGGAKPFEIVTAAPAGALSVSAMDITHFMIAHLEDGTYNGAQILSPATIALMHSRQYAPDPRVHAMCLGFYEETRNGHRIIGHGGDTQWFHSDLHLILDAHTGLFVSYNSAGRGDVAPRGPLFDKFLDRYFPYTPPMTKPLETAEADARAVAGSYIATRRSQTNFLYLLDIMGELTVAPGPDGTLATDFKNIAGQPIKWQEVGPQIWQDPADAQNRLLFDKRGDGSWKIILGFPAEYFQQVHWYQSKKFIQLKATFFLLVFGLTLLLWPVAALVRWHYGSKVEAGDRERRARCWARVVCAINLIFWVAFGTIIVEAGSHLGLLSQRNDWIFRLIQIVGWLGVFGTIPAIWNFFVSIGTAGRWWWAKVHDTLILAACITSVWLIWFTHMLAFRLRF
jgi:CubicO group peptidase (beta-lactamase class C family)